MYAVIKTGGKQYRIAEGEKIRVEKLEVEKDSVIEFDQVLAVGEGDKLMVGSPLVEGAKVTADVIDHGREKKINVIKFRRRKDSMTKQGHRQYYTELRIKAIKA